MNTKEVEILKKIVQTIEDQGCVPGGVTSNATLCGKHPGIPDSKPTRETRITINFMIVSELSPEDYKGTL